MSSSSGSNDGGLMSSAGLVRYFESTDQRSIRISPKTILAVSTLLSFTLIVAHGVV